MHVGIAKAYVSPRRLYKVRRNNHARLLSVHYLEDPLSRPSQHVRNLFGKSFPSLCELVVILRKQVGKAGSELQLRVKRAKE